MLSCCRRTTSASVAEATAAARFPSGQWPPSSVVHLNVNNGQFWQQRGAGRIILRARGWMIEAVATGGDNGDELKKRNPLIRCFPLDRKAVSVTLSNGGGVDRRTEVIVAAMATVILGVGNRVLYKLALVPLKHYPFFLAQLATFGYVIVYFSILYLRYQAGKVTDEMLALPKSPLVLVGLLEALGAAAGMSAAAILSGATIPILSQSFLVWQLALSYIFIGRRYLLNQLFGCFLVAVGVIITVASFLALVESNPIAHWTPFHIFHLSYGVAYFVYSGSNTGPVVENNILWSILMIISFLFQAADTVLKERIFLDAAQRLKGCTVDIFFVNSYGSAYQAVFICLLIPFLSSLWGIPFRQLPNYIKDGAACFLNVGTMSKRCDGAPLLPLLFVLVNMGYNISLLHLIKISSAVVSCLASTISVPISVYLFTLPLPYLGVASSLPPGFVAGAVILAVGLLIYIWTPSNSSSSPVVS